MNNSASKLSPLKLNIAIAKLTSSYVDCPKGYRTEVVGNVQHYIDRERILYSCHHDYLDDYSELIPLSLDYEISTSNDLKLGTFTAQSEKHNITVTSQSHPRALAECIYLVLEKESKENDKTENNTKTPNTDEEIDQSINRLLNQSTGSIVLPYCNNWGNLMPLVEKLGIEHHKTNNKEYRAVKYMVAEATNTSLKRALSECVLLVLQKEQLA